MSGSHRSNQYIFPSDVSQFVYQYWHLYWACHCKLSFSQKIIYDTNISVKSAFFHRPINQMYIYDVVTLYCTTLS